MEAPSAFAPLVLVLRGSMMSAVASASAPGSLPPHKAPAQIKRIGVEARVEILSPVIVPSKTLASDGALVVDGHRLIIRKRWVIDGPAGSAQLIVDLP